MPGFASEDNGDVRGWVARIRLSARAGEVRTLAVLVKAAAPVAAIAGRTDLIARWLAHLPAALIEHDPQLLYWSGASIVIDQPADAHPRLERAFAMFDAEASDPWQFLAWAGLLDATFLLYRDLRECDPLLAWMTPEREAAVDRMPRPLRSLIVASTLSALVFRAPMDCRLAPWRERAEKLVEINPTSDLGARLSAILMLDYIWRGDFAAADILWTRFEARASGGELSPMSLAMRHLNTATLRLHQGRCDDCLAAVRAGLAQSAGGGVRIWDSLLHCHAAAASLSRGAVVPARAHLAAIEQLFADGIPADEAYYRALLLWCDFVEGRTLGVVPRCENAMAITDQKGVPYFMAVCRMACALVLFEAGHRLRGRTLLAEGQALGQQMGNLLLAWIGGLFGAHMAYVDGESSRADALLREALQIGRDRELVHFMCWPREIVAGLLDRALAHGIWPEYLARLISIHGYAPGNSPARSEHWTFIARIHTFGDPRVVDARGAAEPLSAQLLRQVELLAALIGRGARPAPIAWIAAELYPDGDVDPAGSVKRVLHSLRRRVGAECIVQRDAALALDFRKVWVDACSLLQLRNVDADPVEIESWLDRHYHGHFMERVEGSNVVASLRRRLAETAARTIGRLVSECDRNGEYERKAQLSARWQTLFPDLF